MFDKNFFLLFYFYFWGILAHLQAQTHRLTLQLANVPNFCQRRQTNNAVSVFKKNKICSFCAKNTNF